MGEIKPKALPPRLKALLMAKSATAFDAKKHTIKRKKLKKLLKLENQNVVS